MKFYALLNLLALMQLPSVVAASILLSEREIEDGVFGSTRLLLWCIIGASGGGYCSVYCFPPKASKTTDDPIRQVLIVMRRMLGKFAVSAFTGTFLTPMLVRLMFHQPQAELLVGSSFAVAFIAVAAFHYIAMSLERRKQVVYITNNIETAFAGDNNGDVVGRDKLER